MLRRGLRRFAILVVVVLLLGSGLAAGTRWMAVSRQVDRLVDTHLGFEVAHPGWSFPARVWTASAPLDLPVPRLVLEARARGYVEACPPQEPGEFCPEDGAVIPRGGRFPEGIQPAGSSGWNRPLALEPLLVATLVGPDAEIREHLPVADAPWHLLAAILVAEDEDFEHHHGVNVLAAIRALWSNTRAGRYHQGASTLTMQVVRNLSGRKEKTLDRKAWEALAAVALERKLGKDGVLQVYLDAPYLGQDGAFSICGFQAAARWYWGVDARDLTLARSATLAAILPAPGRFDPIRSPEEARARRDTLLERMGERGMDVAEALAEPMDASPHPIQADRWPAFLQAVRHWMEQEVPASTLYGAGLDVFTGLDPVAQETSDRILPERRDWIRTVLGLRRTEPIRAAAALLDPTTGLMVAIHDEEITRDTDFSRVTQARRQAGSSFKPVVYALAFNQQGPDGKPRWTAAHTVPNTTRKFEGTDGWTPRNVGGEYSVTTTLAMGLAWSQNIATASLLEEAGGPDALLPFAARAGFDTSRWKKEMGLALGQGEVTVLEMTRFVAEVVNGGRYVSGRPVDVALDPTGRVRVPPAGLGEAVMTPEAAALTRDLMRLVVEYGTGGRVRGTGGHAGVAGPCIGKTGTTDDEWDLWFTGATPTYAGTLWVGYDQPRRIGCTASDFAAPLWGWWMRAVHEGLPLGEFGGLKLEHHAICTITGRYGNETCRLIGAPFLPGTKPQGVCPYAHPPPAPEEEPREGVDEEEYRSLWDRLAAERAEEAAEAAGPIAAPPPGGLPEP
ncbi:MAG: transglycosylase domain-containing protein [Deltaproteobacteria bacterium]|nr:transglycosylase domain-containing protein [Deltaproteobacteria bacterium]